MNDDKYCVVDFGYNKQTGRQSNTLLMLQAEKAKGLEGGRRCKRWYSVKLV